MDGPGDALVLWGLKLCSLECQKQVDKLLGTMLLSYDPPFPG